MSELALYRKYRSASFESVIGQPQVVETLQQAIATNRLSHAYLFTGPRGVGKTSVARLLAKAANCTHKDPAKRPCGECQNCKMAIGSHLDLIEIDAASNRGIDDARALREKITSAPSVGRYKVYIIDEVHMLTTEAFNALLKTLEEPPPHAMFILATTEAHKLPETIISRTQRFNFKLISTKDLVAQLSHIATEEHIEINEAALQLLAEASRGGFRDAISLLDQVGSSGIRPLTEKVVRQLLGHSDQEILTAINEAVRSQHPKAVLASVDTALHQGVQASQIGHQLVSYWRHELQTLVQSDPPDTLAIRQRIVYIETLLPTLKSSWPELSLEAALLSLATRELPQTFSAPPQKPAQIPVHKPTPPTAPMSSVVANEIEAEVPNPDLWMKALAQIKQKNNSLYALLRSCSLEFEGDKVIIGCKFTFFRDRLKESKNLEMLEQTLSRIYGRKLRVLPQLEAKTPVSAVVDPSAELMSSALEILGGEVIHE